jgi:phage-related protein
MRGTLTVAGTNLHTQYKVYINGRETFDAPRKKYNYVQIPNRNGELLGAERHFENVIVRYPDCGIETNFDTNIQNLRNFLLSRDGYVKISDSYHPNEFRMGVYEGPFSVNPTELMDAGQFDLQFNCKPQRYLNSGDTSTDVTSSANFTNPSMFPSRPWLRVYGTGGFLVGGITCIIDSSYNRSYMDIDCETMECTYDSILVNQYLELSKGNSLAVDFPSFAGSSISSVTIGSGSSVTKITVKPRWFFV